MKKLLEHKMSKLNQLCERNDYEYILSLTFIQKQKQGAKAAA